MQNKIVHFLKSAEGYISGEEISRQLKISRAGIWKYMQELRDDGYEIVAVPHLGYRLDSSPDKLSFAEISHGLKTKFLGREIVYFDSIGSTMDEAFQRAVDGAKEGTVVCAESQNKGRGRMGRSWQSPKGKGIYASIIFRPKLHPTDVAKLTIMSAVAVSTAVKNISQLPTKIKWPNDILLNNRKLAGILTEMSAEMDRVRFVVLGLGLNVNATENQLPDVGTSMKIAAGHHFSRVEVFQEVLYQLENWYEILQTKGFGEVVSAWNGMSATLGRRVKIQEANHSIEGEAVGLDDLGALIIRTENGTKVRRLSGDVVFI